MSDEPAKPRRDLNLPQFPAGSGDPVWDEPTPAPRNRPAAWSGGGAVLGVVPGAGLGFWRGLTDAADAGSGLAVWVVLGVIGGALVGGFAGWLWMSWLAERAARRRHLDK